MNVSICLFACFYTFAYMCTYTEDNCDFSSFYDPISIKKKESGNSISLFSFLKIHYLYVFAYICTCIEVNCDFIFFFRIQFLLKRKNQKILFFSRNTFVCVLHCFNKWLSVVISFPLLYLLVMTSLLSI